MIKIAHQRWILVLGLVFISDGVLAMKTGKSSKSIASQRSGLAPQLPSTVVFAPPLPGLTTSVSITRAGSNGQHVASAAATSSHSPPLSSTHEHDDSSSVSAPSVNIAGVGEQLQWSGFDAPAPAALPVRVLDLNLSLELLERAQVGDEEDVQALLSSGADANAADESGVTALMWASWGGHVKVVKALLGERARIEAADGVGIVGDYEDEDCIELAKLIMRDEGRGTDVEIKMLRKLGGTALTMAVWRGRKEHKKVVKLLLGSGADVNTKLPGNWTLLMLAARKGSAPVVQLLLDKNADMAVKNFMDRTALDIARRFGAQEVVEKMAGSSQSASSYPASHGSSSSSSAGNPDGLNSSSSSSSYSIRPPIVLPIDGEPKESEADSEVEPGALLLSFGASQALPVPAIGICSSSNVVSSSASQSSASSSFVHSPAALLPSINGKSDAVPEVSQPSSVERAPAAAIVADRVVEDVREFLLKTVAFVGAFGKAIKQDEVSSSSSAGSSAGSSVVVSNSAQNKGKDQKHNIIGVALEVFGPMVNLSNQDQVSLALSFAAFAGRVDQVRRFLPVANDQDKGQALITAAKNGHEKVVDVLLRSSSERLSTYDAALKEAQEGGYTEVVQVMEKWNGEQQCKIS